jgi:glycosyltransferase involved in cell wall biosynthesis
MEPTISVVVPVYNERENLPALLNRLLPVLGRIAGESFEVVLIDDGSSDGSADILDALTLSHENLRVIHLSRNFGHQAALQAGLDEAAGQAVVLMDADLQDPPEVLERFVEYWRQGHEVVYAVRTKRKETRLKRLSYSLFYRTLRLVAEIEIPLDAGDFCLLDRRVVDALVSLRERHRFLRGLRSWVGFKQIGVEYDRDSRHAGPPKYTLGKLVRLAFAGYIGFSTLPLRAAAWLGVASAGTGFGLALWAIVTKFMQIPSPRGWASTLSVILVVSGVQLLMLGIIGEYLGRVYDEVRQRPLYVVRDRPRSIQPKRATSDEIGAELTARQRS